MDKKYLEQKQEEIMLCFNTAAITEQQKKFIKCTLEAIWLAGEIQGIQEAKELIRRPDTKS